MDDSTKRLHHRRNNAAHALSPAASLALRVKMEEEHLSSTSEQSSESSDAGDEGDDEDKGLAQGPGDLLQALTSKWKSYNERMVVQLVRSGVDLDERLPEPWDIGFKAKQTIGATPLHFAARLGLVEVCQALVECKASVDSQTQTGVSSLMVAVMFSNLQIAEVLVDAKASVLLQEACGMTVTDLAILEGDHKMVELLLRREREEELSNEEEAIQAAVAAGADLSLLPPMQNQNDTKDEDVLAALINPEAIAEDKPLGTSDFSFFG